MKNSNVEIKQSNEEMKKQTSSPVDSTRLWAEIAGNEHVVVVVVVMLAVTQVNPCERSL